MPRMMPYDKIPDSNTFPTGTYHVEGVKMEERQSSTGKLMYAIDVKVLDHPATAPFTNMHFFNNFVIGSDEDPEAANDGTWIQSFGAKRVKQMVAAAQIPEKNDMDKICDGFAGCQFMLSLRAYKEPELDRQGMANQYAGQERNDISSFAKVGSKEPSIDQAAAAASAAAPTAPPPPPGQGPAAGAPPVGAVAPVQTTVASDGPPAAPAAAPQTTAGPAVETEVTQPPVQPVPQPANNDGQVATLPCTVCHQQIPNTEFAAHFQQCMLNSQSAQVPQG